MKWRRAWRTGKRRRTIITIHNHVIDRVALGNAMVSGLALFPQWWQLAVTGDSSGLSAVSMMLLLVNNVVWGVYAIHRGLVTILVAAIFNVLASGGILVLLLVR